MTTKRRTFLDDPARKLMRKREGWVSLRIDEETLWFRGGGPGGVE